MLHSSRSLTISTPCDGVTDDVARGEGISGH